jgi:hypothetical protein
MLFCKAMAKKGNNDQQHKKSNDANNGNNKGRDNRFWDNIVNWDTTEKLKAPVVEEFPKTIGKTEIVLNYVFVGVLCLIGVIIIYFLFKRIFFRFQDKSKQMVTVIQGVMPLESKVYPMNTVDASALSTIALSPPETGQTFAYNFWLNVDLSKPNHYQNLDLIHRGIRTTPGQTDIMAPLISFGKDASEIRVRFSRLSGDTFDHRFSISNFQHLMSKENWVMVTVLFKDSYNGTKTAIHMYINGDLVDIVFSDSPIKANTGDLMILPNLKDLNKAEKIPGNLADITYANYELDIGQMKQMVRQGYTPDVWQTTYMDMDLMREKIQIDIAQIYGDTFQSV